MLALRELLYLQANTTLPINGRSELTPPALLFMTTPQVRDEVTHSPRHSLKEEFPSGVAVKVTGVPRW